MARTHGRTPLTADEMVALLPAGTEHETGRGSGQITAEFPNGYGVSIIDHEWSYDLELAVTHQGHLCYATPVTSDVLGFLTDEEARAAVTAVQSLPEDPDCSHVHKANQ